VTRREPPKNVAASVRARLTSLARERGEDFQLVLTRYGLERLLYRLSRSPHRDEFVLKGAMLFQVWSDEPHRHTRDLDLLDRGPNTIERFSTIFRDICAQPVEEDGLAFLADRIRGEEIRENQEYNGLRMRFEGRLANIRIPVQIDIGFGDAITPGPMEIEFPTLLDLPSPVLHAYSREPDRAIAHPHLPGPRVTDLYILVGKHLRAAVAVDSNRFHGCHPLSL
jgi:hypothetical protein